MLPIHRVLLAASLFSPALHAQAPPARWMPELAFMVKRVGTVAVSPDGLGAAIEVSEPVMDAEPSEWRQSVRVYSLEGAGARTPRMIEAPASAPAWSPDGRWIAFVSDRLGKRNVWRVGLDGVPAERLTDVAGELGEFRWSPDGSAIVFSHSPSPSGDDWVRSDVSVVDLATGRVRPLATTPAAEGGVAWSPDGRWIALTVSDAPASYALTFRVVLVAPTGGARRQHGEIDLRVPVSQGYELYTALERRKVPVTMVVYPRQGHGIAEPKLQLDVMQRNLEWFERWVNAGPGKARP